MSLPERALVREWGVDEVQTFLRQVNYLIYGCFFVCFSYRTNLKRHGSRNEELNGKRANLASPPVCELAMAVNYDSVLIFDSNWLVQNN